MSEKKIGLIAGNGELPILATKAMQKAGYQVLAGAVTAEAFENLKSLTEAYKYSPWEAFSILKKAKELNIKEVVFIGKVPKTILFQNLHKFDFKIISELKKMLNFNDDSIHLKLVDFVEKEHGIKIVDQTKFLRELFPAEQVFTKRVPTKSEYESIQYGLKHAKAIAAYDIGQTVVVSDSSIYAVEAIEGTDKCIQRAYKLANSWQHSRELIVCKVAKPDQDNRFDVPAVGLRTLKSIKKNGILAFEAHETFFVNQKEAIAYADKHNIAIVSAKLAV
jgi:DUF1009 family protein